MNHPDLPEAEWELLACLRRKGQATAAELREALRPFRRLAHPSVATLLQRLEGKGLVTREKGKVGKAFVYRPTQRSGATLRAKLSRLVQRAFAGDSVALVASLFETQPPSGEELDQVQRLLEELRQKGRTKP
jgi:BlaI family transcriptional regulator, penicillinase repressor